MDFWQPRRVTATALLIALSAGSATGQPTRPPSCTRISEIIKPSTCRPVGDGFVVAVDPTEAKRLAEYVKAGGERFRRYFGGEPPRVAIVQGGTRADQTALRTLGIPRALPFPTSAQYEEAALASMIRSAEAQARAAGLDDQRIGSMKEQVRQRWLDRNPPSARQAREAGVIPHELGHLWLIERYWPGSSVDTNGHYGGPGPDWLDELGAVLMESDQLTAERRAQFSQGMSGDGTLTTIGVTRERLLDLERFLTIEHPMRDTQEALRNRPNRSASGVTVLTGEEARLAAGESVNFYLLARMFADWAMTQSGNERIFDVMARAFADGMTLDTWLAQSGRRWRLGATMKEMADAWRASANKLPRPI